VSSGARPLFFCSLTTESSIQGSSQAGGGPFLPLGMGCESSAGVKEDAMKKNFSRKLNLNRETLRQLDDSDLRVLAGAVVTGDCPLTLQLACYESRLPTCLCTGTGPTV